MNFLLLSWREQIIRDLFGVVKPDGYRQFNTAYVSIVKKNGKSELAASVLQNVSRLLLSLKLLPIW